MSKTYTLLNLVYLDNNKNCYKKIVTIDEKPNGPLSKYVKQVQKSNFPKLNTDNCNYSNKCIYALADFNNTSNFLGSDEIGKLFGFLKSNNYTIEMELTKMINDSPNKIKDLLCFISYG